MLFKHTCKECKIIFVNRHPYQPLCHKCYIKFKEGLYANNR